MIEAVDLQEHELCLILWFLSLGLYANACVTAHSQHRLEMGVGNPRPVSQHGIHRILEENQGISPSKSSDLTCSSYPSEPSRETGTA